MTHTPTTLSEKFNIQPRAIQETLKRMKAPRFGVDENIPEQWVQKLLKRYAENNTPAKQRVARELLKVIDGPIINGAKPESNPNVTPSLEVGRDEKRESAILKVLPYLPLPMLGLAASYGVYFFSSQFIPAFWAGIEAAAFELTYIGLSLLSGLDDEAKKLARFTAWGAVFVSVIYNTMTAALHLEPMLFENITGLWFWLLAFTHGAPLAVLGYLVANLVIHKD